MQTATMNFIFLLDVMIRVIHIDAGPAFNSGWLVASIDAVDPMNRVIVI